MVENSFINPDKEIYELRISNSQGAEELFYVTDNHPFWVEGEGWVDSGKLLPGMEIAGHDVGPSTVIALRNLGYVEETYNFTVQDNHSYFVGENRVLVHNCSCDDVAKSGQKLLVSPRQHLLDSVTDPKLRNRVDALYRPNAKVGSGSTADAIRHELRTGELLSPKGHVQKGIEMRSGLMNDLRSGRLNATDSTIARQILKDLQNALSGQ